MLKVFSIKLCVDLTTLCTVFASTNCIVDVFLKSLTSVVLGSLHVHEEFVYVRHGAVMETMTAETGRMRPTAQVNAVLLTT